MCVLNFSKSQLARFMWFQLGSLKVLGGGMETGQKLIASLENPNQPSLFQPNSCLLVKRVAVNIY